MNTKFNFYIKLWGKYYFGWQGFFFLHCPLYFCTSFHEEHSTWHTVRAQ